MTVDLIIGGASKAGTTALYDMLRQRHEFFLPTKKELHYFAWPELSRTTAGPGDAHVMAEIPQSLPAYRSYYHDKQPGQIAVDVSPSYLFHHSAAELIAKELPEARLAFILRNPVDKVFSQYVHLMGEGRETLSFEEALTAEESRRRAGFSDMWLYRQSGYYADAIAHFQEVLGRDRVMVILFDDFRREAAQVLRELCRFTGLDGSQTFDSGISTNVSGAPKSLLLARLIAPNPLTRLLRRIIPTSLGVAVRRLIRDANTGAKPMLDPATRTELLAIYEADIRRLETLIGRPTGWLPTPTTKPIQMD